jgi:predicted dehydrogenase
MPLKVAVIGCGKIADLHVQQILRVPDVRIVGVCDREPLMAEQLRNRFPIDRDYNNPEQLLGEANPDVVHITTPPESHLTLGKLCLEHGAHVYIEKPFTVDLDEAEELISAAERAEKKLTVGHNVQFTRPAIEMRRTIANGFLGGAPVHMDSYYGYDLGDARYAKALLGDRDHWVRRLPGKLFQNIISHGISKIAEFLPSEDPEITAVAFPSRTLRLVGEAEVTDELRVMILDRATGVTANFMFSTQARPILHQFRVYGTKNGLLTDDDHMVLVKLKGRRHKSYLEQFIPSALIAWQYVANGTENLYRLMTRELHNDMGMKNLIEAFYSSIRSGAAPPIPYREILLTTRIMQKIFKQIYPEDGRSVSEVDRNGLAGLRKSTIVR